MNDNLEKENKELKKIIAVYQDEIEFLCSENDMLMKQNKLYHERNDNLKKRNTVLRSHNDSLIDINKDVTHPDDIHTKNEDMIIEKRLLRQSGNETELTNNNMNQAGKDKLIESNDKLMEKDNILHRQDEMINTGNEIDLENINPTQHYNDNIAGSGTNENAHYDKITLYKDSKTEDKDNMEVIWKNVAANNDNGKVKNDNIAESILYETSIPDNKAEKISAVPQNKDSEAGDKNSKAASYDSVTANYDSVEVNRNKESVNNENANEKQNRENMQKDNVKIDNEMMERIKYTSVLKQNIKKEIVENMTGTLRKEYANKMMSRWAEELIFFMNNKKVKTEMMLRAMGISTATFMWDINLFRRKGWIEFYGYKKRGYYVMTEKGMEFVNKGEQ